MRLEKIEGDLLPYLKKISLPIKEYEHPQFYRWFQTSLLTDEMIEMQLQSMPFLLWGLATQAFYWINLEENKSFYTMIYESSEAFERQKDSLPLLFRKVLAYPVRSSLTEEPLWQVQMEGISELGCRILKKLKRESRLPPELINLYWKTGFASDWQEKAMFVVTEDHASDVPNKLALYEPSPLMRFLLQNPFFNSIDLSGMTLRQCIENDLVRYTVHHKKEVYLLTLDYSEAEHQGPFTKRLFWV